MYPWLIVQMANVELAAWGVRKVFVMLFQYLHMYTLLFGKLNATNTKWNASAMNLSHKSMPSYLMKGHVIHIDIFFQLQKLIANGLCLLHNDNHENVNLVFLK